MSDMSSNAAWIWAARGAGAVSGSAISLAYMLPKGPREAAARFVVGIVSGLVFGAAAGVKIASLLGIAAELGQLETLLMGSAAASLSAWWALGFALRAIGRRQSAMGEATDDQ
jgi:hypothetical protein